MSKSAVDPYDNPQRNRGVLNNLVYNFQLIHVMPMLQEMTFDQVVELWWAAQMQKTQPRGMDERQSQPHQTRAR